MPYNLISHERLIMKLERKDLQQLQHALKDRIHSLEHCKEMLNDQINATWNASIPDTELGKKAFKRLNRFKDDKRYVRKQLKITNDLQRKIKLMLSNSTTI